MATVRVAPTGEVLAGVLAAARDLLAAVFTDGFTDHDWAHALGGVHAWVADPSGAVLAHGSLVRRRMWVGEVPVEVGYVEAVAVRLDHRRQGLGAAVMTALEQYAPAYDLLALSSTADGLRFYRSRGWVAWRGPTGVRRPGRDVATPEEDGTVLALRGSWDGLDPDAPLRCEPRAGDDW